MKDILIIRQPSSEEEYSKMYELRWRILRKPWNQPKGTEKDDIDLKKEGCYNFVAISNDKILATARLHSKNEHEGEISYIAIEDEFRNKGITKNIIDHLEWFAIGLGIPYITLNTRESEKKFYQDLKYTEIGKAPLLFDQVEQVIMGKQVIDLK